MAKDTPIKEPKGKGKGAGAPGEPEPGMQFVIPEPERGTLTLNEIPNAAETYETNIRTVRRQGTETPEQALDRVLGIGRLMVDIETSAPGMIPALQVAEWTKAPEWLKALASEGKISYQPFKRDGKTVYRAILDGNRREMALRRLAGKHKQGHTITLKTHDESGAEITSQVTKTYDEIPVTIYHELKQDQFRQLQLVSANREQFRRGDIAKAGIELIQNNPLGVSEADLEAHFGASNRRALTTAEKFHGKAQEIRRAALSPKDVTQQYIDYLNGEPGVNHPNHADLRDFWPAFKTEFASWDGGKFVKGKYFDPEFNIRTMTSDDLEGLWRMWTEEQCKAAGLPEGKTPADVSEFLAKWKTIRNAKKQDRKAGTKADQQALQKMEGGFAANDAQFLADFTKSVRGAPNCADLDKMTNFICKFEAASKAALRKHEPDLYKALMEEFKVITAVAATTTPATPASTGPEEPAGSTAPEKKGSKK